MPCFRKCVVSVAFYSLVVCIHDSHAYKQLLDEAFVISRIIKVEVGVISRSLRLPHPIMFYYTLNESKNGHENEWN